MSNKDEPVRLKWSDGIAAGIVCFLLYLAFVQGMQGSAKGLYVGKYAKPFTVLIWRFVGVGVVVFALACANFIRTGSLKYLKPDDYVVQLKRGGAQIGQSAFIIGAATQLTNSFQAAVSLVTVPLWVSLLGNFYKKDARSGQAKWFGVFAYAIVSFLMLRHAAVGKGSLWIGILCLLGSGYCTAQLQYLTKAGSGENLLTAAFWQNVPAALVSTPFLFRGVVGNLAVPLPVSLTAWGLLGLMVFFSPMQQVFLQLSQRRTKSTIPTEQMNSLRGFGVWIGSVLDSTFFGVVLHASDYATLVGVLFATVAGWFFGKPKKVTA